MPPTEGRSTAAAVAIAALTLSAVAWPGGRAEAQPAPPTAETREWKDLLGANRIDGSTLRSGFVSFGREPGSGFPDLARNSPAVVMDGYSCLVSEIDGSPPETIVNESYVFTRPTTGTNRIRFVIPIKVPMGGLPGEMTVDAVIIPCRLRLNSLLGAEDMPPPPTPRLFIDDVLIGNPGSASSAYTTFAFFDVENVESLIGTGSFDWFAVIEFNSNSLSDTDGNGNPDVGIETFAGGVGYRFTPTADEVGASVIEFFAGNVNRVNVYEPAGTQPPPRSGFPGNQVGETGVTRPWCFTIN
jgi:hypothetical protein